MIGINATASNLGVRSIQLFAEQPSQDAILSATCLVRGKLLLSVMLKRDMNLEALGNHDVITVGKQFVSLLCSEKEHNTSMNHLRHTLFVSSRDKPYCGKLLIKINHHQTLNGKL